MGCRMKTKIHTYIRPTNFGHPKRPIRHPIYRHFPLHNSRSNRIIINNKRIGSFRSTLMTTMVHCDVIAHQMGEASAMNKTLWATPTRTLLEFLAYNASVARLRFAMEYNGAGRVTIGICKFRFSALRLKLCRFPIWTCVIRRENVWTYPSEATHAH